MEKIYSFDIEANGLNPSQIFVLGIHDWNSDEFTAYTSENDDIAEGLIRLAEADLFCGHYILGFDIPVIERLSDGLIKIDRSKVIDTCDLSRALFPRLQDHKLRTWGEILNYPKGDFSDFSKFDARMIPYCEQDCRITTRLAKFFLEILADKAPKAF